MRGRDLDAAGIMDLRLRDAYTRCRRLNAAHGKTYFLATQLLPTNKRPFVHALYGFARYVDDIVDNVDQRQPVDQHQPLDVRAEALEIVARRFLTDFKNGASDHPVFAATIDTAVRWRIPGEHFELFLESMRMDLEVTSYSSYDELYQYMYGSAAVIGLQMVPILGARNDEAYGFASDLGVAFQLANFIRDVGEDLDRGRIYLPLDELAEFEVTADDLRRREVTPRLRAALAFQIHRVRRLERDARPGIELLAPDSRAGIDAARILYCEIVDEVERIDYQVFTRRAQVPLARRLHVAGRAWLSSRRTRHWDSLNP